MTTPSFPNLWGLTFFYHVAPQVIPQPSLDILQVPNLEVPRHMKSYNLGYLGVYPLTKRWAGQTQILFLWAFKKRSAGQRRILFLPGFKRIVQVKACKFCSWTAWKFQKLHVLEWILFAGSKKRIRTLLGSIKPLKTPLRSEHAFQNVRFAFCVVNVLRSSWLYL